MGGYCWEKADKGRKRTNILDQVWEFRFENSVPPKTEGNKTVIFKAASGLSQGAFVGIPAHVGFPSEEIRDGFCPKKEEIIPYPFSPEIGGSCEPPGELTENTTESSAPIN